MAITVTVTSELEFRHILLMPKAIIYILVEWSAMELVSRHLITTLYEEADGNSPPLFIIDCSNEDTTYVNEWLLKQNPSLRLAGWGETMLVENGKVIAFIQQPFYYPETTKIKIRSWL